jgi:RNA-directed DNA polymerase
MRSEQRDRATCVSPEGQPYQREEPVAETKSFRISNRAVWEAWLKVRANQGAAGVDGRSIASFEKRLKLNLYKIWNRMSSGTYFPPPVKTVKIPKPDGKERTLGIPTVGDRVAQMVLKLYLEPSVEPCFHQDSYGYRPKKFAADAVGQARRRCWRHNWVVDLDIKGFFDNIDHALMMRAVRKHTDCPWMLLYIERWLKAPAQLEDGTLVHRGKGTPQGGVASPLLANIFLHHAFDMWMAAHYPSCPFERYADDVVVHCRSRGQAEFILRKIEKRLKACQLQAHPEKTKIIYCKDGKRKEEHVQIKFDFLGYSFRPRTSIDRGGEFFVNFSPGVSTKASKAIATEIRRWQLYRKSDKSLEDLSRKHNGAIRGWVNYYGRYYRSALYPVFRCLNRRLVRWAQRKFKRYRSQRRATQWLRAIARKEPNLFAHWKMGAVP